MNSCMTKSMIDPAQYNQRNTSGSAILDRLHEVNDWQASWRNFRAVVLLCITLCSVALSVEPRVSGNSLYEDMTDNLKGGVEALPGKVYRMWETGICGTVESDHIKVTHVIPGSVADGKIQKGDLIRGMQHRSMEGWGGITKLVRLRLYRIGRDWNWHFYVTVERPSLRNGKGNTLVYDLHMPPVPGNTCHFGPTGFFAERHPTHLVVNVIEQNSPADGTLMKGDVILSVNGQPITGEVFEEFTRAIDHSESMKGKGLLKLRIRRTSDLPEGSTATKTSKKMKKVLFTPLEDTMPTEAEGNKALIAKELDVTLKLKTLGEYSETAPLKCPKTEALITQTAEYIVKNKDYGELQWGLLGLLATGEEKYIKVVRDYLHDPKSWAKPPTDPKEIIKNAMYVSWRWGYQNLLLTEYFLLTGDKYVLPTITQLSRSLAAGQDPAGLWGHRMAHSESGRAYGYGVMNQPSLPIFISLILAEKCGVKDTLVRTAIQRSHDHYNKWVGVGSLPYGNHGPGVKSFTNNGTSGSLAVAFALLGNKKGAEFYSGMSAAATEEILLGHGGPVWNILWSGLGTNVLGPEITRAYAKKTHWLRTATRTWKGGYVEMKGWGSDPHSKRSWDTGCYLLNLCAGRRAISITGKGMPKSLWVNEKRAKEIVEVGNLDTSSDQTLLNQLGSSFPPVRYRAAQELVSRDAMVRDEVMNLLSTGTRNQRIGALHAIQGLKIERVVNEILAIVLDEKDDPWVRRLATQTLAGLDEAKPHAPKILEMLVRKKEYDQPYGELDMALGKALVKLYEPDPYATNPDKDLFYRGVIKLLNHKHGVGRGAGMTLLRNIPKEDLPKMIDLMVYLFEDEDKTYTFYAGKGRQEVLEILYQHGIKESMEYTVDTLKQGRNGQRRARMRLLKTFGGEASYLIPKIKEVLGEEAEPIVEQIEKASSTKEMVSMAELLSTYKELKK